MDRRKTVETNKLEAQRNGYIAYLIVNVGRHGIAGSQKQFALQLIRMHVDLQIRSTQPPVPVVGDMTAVHDFAKQISQVVPRYLSDEKKRVASYKDPVPTETRNQI